MTYPLREYGQKTSDLLLPVFINLNTSTIHTVTLTDAPKAGQAWKIDSVFFSYPEAFNNAAAKSILSVNGEGILTVILRIDGVEQGKKEIVVTYPPGYEAPATNPPIRGYIGTIEPIRPTFMYSSLELEIKHSTTNVSLNTGRGPGVVNYTLFVHDR